MRILINSSRASALSQLFPPAGTEFRLCTSLSQMRKALPVFIPHMVLFDEDAAGDDPAAALANTKKVLQPNTYLATLTRKTTTAELCHRMVADALLHAEDPDADLSSLLASCKQRKAYLSDGLRAVMECPLSLRAKLSKRESQVLNFIEGGLPSSKIATQLNISVETVQNHRKAIREKLGLRGGKTALVSYTA